jgi:prophage regulatory protein
MTDSNTITHSPSTLPAPYAVALRQQGAAAPDSGGRSAAPCGSGQFATVATVVTAPQTRILRLPEVMARVGLKRASIYQHMAAGSFPKQISLGVRAVGWLENEIDQWLSDRISASRISKT